MTRYATTTDLARLGLPASALTGVTSTVQEAALDAASVHADGFLASRFALPLVAWGDDLRRAVCGIAAWDLLRTRGYAPGASNDEAVRLGFEDSERWLRAVQSGNVTPQGVTDSSTGTDEASGQTFCVTNARRDWTRGR